MGSRFDEQIIVLDNLDDQGELRERFQEVVSDCLYNHGHAGYTGTLAEKDPNELEIIEELDGVKREAWDLKEARKHAEGHNDKWGPAFAYRLMDGSWYIAGWCSD